MISMQNVSKWYGQFQVLTECTTHVEKGEVIVVCGPSGSGKSTLIKCVNALEPYQKGDIIVDGIKVNDPKTDLPKLRARVGMVFQNFELFPHLTITPQAARPGRLDRTERQVSWAAFRRPAAARRDRPGIVHGPDLHAFRRADLGARSGNGQRSSRCDGSARQRRHDDDGGHARNGLCAQSRTSRHIHGPGAYRRRREQGQFLRPAPLGTCTIIPVQDIAALTPALVRESTPNLVRRSRRRDSVH